MKTARRVIGVVFLIGVAFLVGYMVYTGNNIG